MRVCLYYNLGVFYVNGISPELLHGSVHVGLLMNYTSQAHVAYSACTSL